MKTMLHNKTTQALTVILVAAAFTSCKKDRKPEVEKETLGVYVLAEGAFPDGNSTIDYYDINAKAVQKNYFKTANGYDLGKNATDLKIYGSKMYCTVTGKKGEKNAYVEVINVQTGKSLKRISFFDTSTSFHPRSIVFYQNKAYVTCYDGNVRAIDTASLTITNTLLLGDVLEGAAIAGNKLYVAKTSQFDFPSAVKDVVSVINLNSFTKIKDITVNFSPVQIESLSNGDVYVQTAGNYFDIDPSVDKISSTTDTKVISYDLNLSLMAFSGAKSLGVTDFGATLKHFNLASGTLSSNFATDDTQIKTTYAVSTNTLNNDVYISDAVNYGPEGIVYAFNNDGKKQFSFTTSAIPKHVVFRYNK